MKKALIEKHYNDIGDVQVIFKYPPRSKADETVTAEVRTIMANMMQNYLHTGA